MFLLGWCGGSWGQVQRFEGQVPARWKASPGGELSLSAEYYKKGVSCLRWDYEAGGKIDIEVPSFTLDNRKENKWGITLWMYNEEPCDKPVIFQFTDGAGQVSYWFDFGLNYTGWRPCWIAFKYMKGEKASKKIAAIRILAPEGKTGRLFFDRLTFPNQNMNDRVTPDAQLPYNNSLENRDLWHWCRLWQWEAYSYDLPLPASLSKEQKAGLATIEKRLDKYTTQANPDEARIRYAHRIFKEGNIRPSGKGFAGYPLVIVNEIDRKDGEFELSDLEKMMIGFAEDAYYNSSIDARNKYGLLWEYALNQGFAFGCGMGTNHHYGYRTREIFRSAWLMREYIKKHPKRKEIVDALCFWSALAETRLPYQEGRDELLDSWHTLLIPKLLSAMLIEEPCERARAMQGLSRWLSTSLCYTPGTIGGIKVDGTTFHHGGFYPAYTTGVYAAFGDYIALVQDTPWMLAEEGRRMLKFTMQQMRNYSNLTGWGIGLGGRHPFGITMGNGDIEAFAALALAGDLTGQGGKFDPELAADYLRLQSRKTKNVKFFTSAGIRPALAPEGFWVYNYGAAGIHRRGNWMVTLKGYNTDVWGSEIYAKDNRYGRYQSYGSVQILGGGSPVSAQASGFQEEGWDWNRLPGATTIHLPYELLESPLPGTLMARSKENFAGSSSLEGVNGMFAIKLMEREYKNFTPDFRARKSVFCFDNRMICLGSGIQNSNSAYATETTLFQGVYDGTGIEIDGQKFHEKFPVKSLEPGKPHCLQDAFGNFYFVEKGKVQVQIADQESRQDKTRAVTKGSFASAWLDHGKAPRGDQYEYMILIQPETKVEEACRQGKPYRVLVHTDTAHGVEDLKTQITAFAVFEAYQPANNALLSYIPAETMVMVKPDGEGWKMSVCDPNLNIAEKTYTTKEPSRVIEKKLVLKGNWEVRGDSEKVNLQPQGEQSLLTVRCQHGQPIEFQLKAK